MTGTTNQEMTTRIPALPKREDGVNEWVCLGWYDDAGNKIDATNWFERFPAIEPTEVEGEDGSKTFVGITNLTARWRNPPSA